MTNPNRVVAGSAARLYFYAYDATTKLPYTTLLYTSTFSTKNSQQRILGAWQTGAAAGVLTNGAEGDAVTADKFIRQVKADGFGNLYSIDIAGASVTNAGGVDAIRLELVSTGVIFVPVVHPITAGETVGKQIVTGDWNTTTPPTAAANADAVRTELAPELLLINTTIPDSLLAITVATSGQSVGPVERSLGDTNSIRFQWPTPGETITGQVMINNSGTYAAITGVIAFLFTEGTINWYTLAFNAADRPATEGTARYKFTDGGNPMYLDLRVEVADLDSATQMQIDDILADTNELQTDWADGGRLDLILDTAIDLESFVLAGIFGNILNAKTPDEAFSIILNGSTYTATQHGLDSDGNRGTAVLVKS